VAGLLAGCGGAAPARPAAPSAGAPLGWDEVRELFALRRDRIHMAGLLLASHPRPVREAIDALRQALDEDPVAAVHATLEQGMDDTVRQAVIGYTGGTIEQVALTLSTTTGLGLLYGGLALAAGDEIVTTSHDHYSTVEALRVAALRAGATVRRVALYQDGQPTTAGAMVAALRAALGPATRVVAVTWVHSGTGMTLPVRAMAEMIAAENARRAPAARILLCVDGVHGFGSRAERVEDLGCDFFVAGCHKWMLGPRGTGIVWGRAEAWPRVWPTIPSFEHAPYAAFLRGEPPPADLSRARMMSPGGFHGFEHRYALPAAIELHRSLGPARVAERIAALASQMKDGLAAMKHVTLITPREPALSAGIVCFEVAGLAPDAVVARLAARNVVASSTPYPVSYARVTPGLWNSPDEVDATLRELRALA
jgi:isopenicillin-N epimerase